MVYRGEFMMDLFADGRSFYVGIMEYIMDGVVYDFVDNEEFFSAGNPYTNLVDDIPKYCFFSKAALAALNYLDWIPDIIHCHDWQAALVPVYLKTLFAGTRVGGAKTMLTIHNLRFQGIYSIPAVKYWSGLPDHLFNIDVLKQGYNDANLMKAGLAYADMITTVSNTYAGEIQTGFYGENLDAHLRHHSGKLRGIVNGIDVELWDSSTDKLLPVENDDLFHALYKLENDAFGILTTTRVAPGEKVGIRFEVQCTKGAIRFDQERMNELDVSYASDGRNAGFRNIKMGPQHGEFRYFAAAQGLNISWQDLMCIQAHKFLEAVVKGQEIKPDIEIAYEVNVLLDALFQSDRENRWVDVVY